MHLLFKQALIDDLNYAKLITYPFILHNYVEGRIIETKEI